MAGAEFDAVFARLRALYAAHAEGLEVRADAPGVYDLWGGVAPEFGKPMWFGGPKIGKRYVSAHLMPVYSHPDLKDGMSDALAGRMQGKSCFNFTRVDAALFEELSALIAAGRARYDALGWTPARQGNVAGRG